jgi:hypothetical protein
MSVVAANHLVTATKAADVAGLGLGADTLKAVGIMRDVFEHWDEQRPDFEDPEGTPKRSGALFRREWPDIDPWHWHRTEADGLVIGPLSFKLLVQDLFEIGEKLRELGVIPTP